MCNRKSNCNFKIKKVMYIPLFPLQSIFFPGEKIPLHIFETRYRQLVHDCKDEAMNFGIPVYLDSLMSYGVEVQLEAISQLYPGGEMDIICTAKRVFKLLSFDQKMGLKPYAGGEVIFLENIDDGTTEQIENIMTAIEVLYVLMEIPSKPFVSENFNSFSLAHKIGLSKPQEFELLQITSEQKRLIYIDTHLKKVIKVLKEVNRTKEVIQLNGHFKNFDPLNFEDFKL